MLDFCFGFIIVRKNEWNLPNFLINRGISSCYNTSLDFVNINHFRETMGLGGGICVTLTHFLSYLKIYQGSAPNYIVLA